METYKVIRVLHYPKEDVPEILYMKLENFQMNRTPFAKADVEVKSNKQEALIKH
jgi:hypothetical protein